MNGTGKSIYNLISKNGIKGIKAIFDSAHKSMTLTENTERADMRKGTMVRVLTTQEEEGFVRYDEISKRYSLGMSIYVLSSNAFQFISVVEAAGLTPAILYLGIWTVFWSSRRRLRRSDCQGH